MDGGQQNSAEVRPARTSFGRLATIAVIFVLLGPFFGGLVMLAIMFFGALFTPGAKVPFELLSPDAIVLLMIPSYIFGAGFAFLVGLIVGVWRIWQGRTTISTPVVAAIIVVVATLSVRLALPNNSHLSSSPNVDFLKFFLPPSLIAAVLCWLIVKKAELA